MKRIAMYTALAGFLLPVSASAATVTVGAGGFNDGYATSVTYESDNAVARRGVRNGRDDATNALGAADGDFFEIGFGSTVDFTFGTSFDDSAAIAEVSFGNPMTFPEAVEVWVGNTSGLFTFVQELQNVDAFNTATISLAGLGGPFSVLRLIDISPFTSSIEEDADGALGGFDVASVRVAPAVPLPASGLMLLGALGGAAALRRKKAKLS